MSHCYYRLEIYKNLGLSLSTITFTVNNHANYHFYKHLFQIFIELPWNITQYETTFFLIKIQDKVFIFKFHLNVKHSFYFFLITMVYTKSVYRKIVFFCRLCKNYWITCCTHVTSHAIWIGEIMRVIISIKQINKN